MQSKKDVSEFQPVKKAINTTLPDGTSHSFQTLLAEIVDDDTWEWKGWWKSVFRPIITSTVAKAIGLGAAFGLIPFEMFIPMEYKWADIIIGVIVGGLGVRILGLHNKKRSGRKSR